jgi:hypothetical protein
MMERVLYGLPDPDPRLPTADERKKMSPEELEAALDKIWKFRQMEIKKAMDAMEDPGMMLTNYTKTLVDSSLETTSPELETALQWLEWNVQDIDLALHFTNIGGMDVCTRLLSHENVQVRQLAAQIAGNAVKNQPKMQALAVSSGLLDFVVARLDKLDAGKDSPECAKLLYAISSTLRGYPDAQQLVAKTDFFNTLHRIVDDSAWGERVAVKALALVADSYNEWTSPPETWTRRLCATMSQRSQWKPSSDAQEPSSMQNEVKKKLAEAMSAAKCENLGFTSQSSF